VGAHCYRVTAVIWNGCGSACSNEAPDLPVDWSDLLRAQLPRAPTSNPGRQTSWSIYGRFTGSSRFSTMMDVSRGRASVPTA